MSAHDETCTLLDGKIIVGLCLTDDEFCTDVSDYVDRLLNSCHANVVKKYKHPDCPHDTAQHATKVTPTLALVFIFI